MDESEILQLIAEGRIEPDEVDEFRDLSEEMQQKIADGELDMDEVEDVEDIL